jgi:undecaprenyl-diphosphatase
MDKKKRNYIISGVLILVAIVFTILVKFIDVKAVGASCSDIGFATINKFIFDLIGTNDLFYTITEYLGYVPLLLVMFYGLVGLKQLVKEKNIKKVDKEILILGGFYVVVAVLYVFFEKCIINYRPILIEGELEASYPSSHTLMTICFCISAIIMNKD